MNATSRVIRDDTLPEAAKLDAKARDDTLLEEALGGKPVPALKRAYLVMLGLSSHDLSAMRELLQRQGKWGQLESWSNVYRVGAFCRLIYFVDPILHARLAFLQEVIQRRKLILGENSLDLCYCRADVRQLGRRTG